MPKIIEAIYENGVKPLEKVDLKDGEGKIGNKERHRSVEGEI